MTTNHPSGLPEQEPTGPTAVVLLGGEAWLRIGVGWESRTKWLSEWGALRDFAAKRGGATLRDLADLTTGLTEAQKEAVRGAAECFNCAKCHPLRDAFPEVFADPADPTGGDPVVLALVAGYTKKRVIFRAEDGTWAAFRGFEKGVWATEELSEIERLSAQTIAELMGGEGNE